MTDGTSQGLFIVVAIVIFGIFVILAYILFEDTLSPALANMFTEATEQAYIYSPNVLKTDDFNIRNNFIPGENYSVIERKNLGRTVLEKATLTHDSVNVGFSLFGHLNESNLETMDWKGKTVKISFDWKSSHLGNDIAIGIHFRTHSNNMIKEEDYVSYHKYPQNGEWQTFVHVIEDFDTFRLNPLGQEVILGFIGLDGKANVGDTLEVRNIRIQVK